LCVLHVLTPLSHHKHDEHGYSASTTRYTFVHFTAKHMNGSCSINLLCVRTKNKPFIDSRINLNDRARDRAMTRISPPGGSTCHVIGWPTFFGSPFPNLGVVADSDPLPGE
jgi:hypothetical protein